MIGSAAQAGNFKEPAPTAAMIFTNALIKQNGK
jgi:hypothetical protein